MQPRLNIRKQYIKMYLLIMAVMIVGSFGALYKNWLDYKAHTYQEMLREISITNTELENLLIDANKLLHVTKVEYEAELQKGPLDDQKIYQILEKTRDIFNIFIDADPYFLSIYVDSNGIARASSENAQITHADLAERAYFQQLKANPNLQYAIGNIVLAKTTGLLTMHIAVPVVNAQGEFQGVLAQQLLVKKMSRMIEKSIDGLAGAQIMTHQDGGRVAFVFPDPTEEKKFDQTYATYLQKFIPKTAPREGSVIVPAKQGTLNENLLMVFAKSRVFGLMTTVTYPIPLMRINFIHSNRFLVGYMLMAFFVVTLIIAKFYKNALVMNDTLTLTLQDTLTGLNNRRAFDTQFPPLWRNAMRTGAPISGLFIDIDHFKILNDTYGHENGDVALKAVAQAVNQCANRPLDFCCRWGGEEFAIVLPETSLEGAITIANHVLQAVRNIKLNFGSDQHPGISVSVGIASMIVTEKNVTDELLDKADKAMYVAKQAGRDQYAIYNEQPTNLRSPN